MKSHITFLGVASSWGAAYRGPEQAPVILWSAGLAEALNRPHVSVDWHGILEPFDPAPEDDQRLDVVYPHIVDISNSVVGGDHSVAIGTWSGVIANLEAQGQFGLLWIDAHMDAHTPITSVQGKWGGHFHGMPLAHLLGHGDKDLCEIGSPKAKLKGKYVALVGVRSYEPGEEKLLRDMGVSVFTMDDIRRDGLDAVMQKAVSIVTAAPKGWGLSFDVDVFDPEDMPAVGKPEPGGLRSQEFLQWLSAFKWPSRPRALEVVEYLPAKDQTGVGLQLIEKILWLLLKK